jgi:hypothetical protein
MDEDGVHINELPDGLLHTTFDLLGPKDLCAISATCKRWRELNQDAAADTVRSHRRDPRFLLCRKGADLRAVKAFELL